MASPRNLLIPAAVAFVVLGSLTTAWLLGHRPPDFTVPVPADWSFLPEGARAAATEAAEACRATPDDPAAFALLGRIYHGNAEPALAIAAYERALILGATDARTPYLLALLYEDWGRVDDAVTMLGLSLQEDDTYGPAWFHLARTQLDTGDVPTAIAAARRAVKFDPSNAAHHACLGRALRRAGRLDEAITVLRQAIALDPDHPGAHQLLGLALRARGDDAAADVQLDMISRYSTEVVRDPWLQEALRHGASVDAQLAWARSYLDVGQLANALKLLRQLAVSHPDHAEVFRRLGETCARGGRNDLAVTAYTRAVTLEPVDVSTRRALAESLLLTGDLPGADREVTVVLAADPHDVDAAVIQAAIVLRRGAVDDAIERLDRLMARRVNHVAGHYWLGEALMTRHRYEEAVDVYERLVELRPNLASARQNLQTASRMLQRTKGTAEP
ncbi:MAG: tetratricopeptide repeat protein [Phycisphaerales bacterium]